MTDAREHLIQSLDAGIRPDGRKALDYRKVSIQYGISKTAEGSARVKIGNTEVLAGVKLEIGEPYPDSPDEGSLMVNAELLPLSSPEFEPGPPGMQAVELARVVDRGIREAKAIDVKKLCIKVGEKIWIVSIDVISVNDDGNLIDAAGLAALAALRDAKYPKYDGVELDYSTKTDKKLPIMKEPIPVTVIKVGNHFIVDPSPEEEKAYDARLTVTTTENGVLCALQKGGESTLTIQDIERMAEIGLEKGKELRKAL